MSYELPNLKHWRFDIDVDNIAWAWFDTAGQRMNTLGREPVEELAEIVSTVEDAAQRGDVKGVVFISSKPNNFIAGADINEFDALRTEKDVEDVINPVIELFNRVERLKVPAVAAINGYCLGGGLEFAMACHYRVATREEGTRIGLPEVKLGIIPGLNGTVRMLQLAGPIAGMQAMLTGKMLRPGAARGMGVVDQLVPSHLELPWTARKAVLQKRKSKGGAWWKRLLTKSPARGYLANRMRKETEKKARPDHYPAPYKLIDLFERHGGDPQRMASAESRTFIPLMISDTSRNLRRVFRLQEMLKDQAPKSRFKPLRLHVIGAGTMGGDIAAWGVYSGMEVSLQDQTQDQVNTALGRAKKLFKKRMRSSRDVDVAMSRLISDVPGEHIKRADVVIEAIVENLDAKQKLFADLEKQLKPGAVLATNTSSLRIEDIAQSLQDPGRLIGLHFFNPVEKMPLVEVVQGEQSREDEVEKGAAFVNHIGKLPLIVKSCPGFLVNRVLAPYLLGSITRLQEGTPKEKLDAAAEKFGMPMGPIELADVVGLDVCMNVNETLGSSPAQDSDLGRLVAAGKLGKKTGQGFYTWEKGKPQKAGTDYDEAELERLGEEMLKPLIDECERVLDDGIVANADLVDAGVIFGTGFAPFRGGPLHYRRSKDKAGESTAQAA
ncbi:3-hydroxyacyl-CoA dehydrogenase NAD-binding domain-containing protein [Dichotomicrobium thermohalophilum]|uniref:enoyl-CoA hydratase n=1 Tax=Dichotomicrobium thermohalophilum TaxID=933063 RepID=A0A397PHX3_9HYPH|nr:3-hydroxyacyl-CoA dehydrogenase NAD-binding domain-containing protein [Dichotomicrobium thermohalophilum]RIA47479.1 3-hydroxyacyl-CoA dehydrogenase/enoyl-CoA hydratase/3-hydroxybutyryl-CoA epimerase [Dichotomicrobium thermohalophilum]